MERTGRAIRLHRGLSLRPGLPKRWRIGGIPNRPSDPQPEVSFISALIDKLSGQYNIDPARIYATVFRMAAACPLSYPASYQSGSLPLGVLAALICILGVIASLLAWCRRSFFMALPTRSYPTRAGHLALSTCLFLPFPKWVEAQARRHGCTSAPQILPVQGQVSAIHYEDCASGAELVFYTITGGGHIWPGGKPLPKFIVGQHNMDIDATRTMWDFFQRHLCRERIKNIKHTDACLRQPVLDGQSRVPQV